MGPRSFRLFFFNDTATTEIYTLSLHDALPILDRDLEGAFGHPVDLVVYLSKHRSESPRPSLTVHPSDASTDRDRKSTRLNSSHVRISDAVSCLRKEEEAGSNDVRRELDELRRA